MKKALILAGILTAFSVNAMATENMDRLYDIMNSKNYYLEYEITRDNLPTYQIPTLSYFATTENRNIKLARSGNNYAVIYENTASMNVENQLVNKISKFLGEEIDLTGRKHHLKNVVLGLNGDAYSYSMHPKHDYKVVGHISYHSGDPEYMACELFDPFDDFYCDFYNRVWNMYPISAYYESQMSKSLINFSNKAYDIKLLESGKEIVENVEYDYEIYVPVDSSKVETRKYYFKNGSLVKVITTDGPIKERSTSNKIGRTSILTIKKLCKEFDESIFAIPQNVKIYEDHHWKNKIAKERAKANKNG